MAALVVLLLCASMVISINGQSTQDILETTEYFIKSLNENQQSWWKENQEKLFNIVVSTAMGFDKEATQTGEEIPGLDDFFKSLDSNQHEMWSRIQDKANGAVTQVLSPAAMNPLVQRSRRAVCGGGCIFSRQCVRWSGSNRCRCTWFSCRSY